MGADLAYPFAFHTEIVIVDYMTFYNGIPLLARHLHASSAAEYGELETDLNYFVYTCLKYGIHFFLQAP